MTVKRTVHTEHGAPLEVLAYIERGLDPEAPLRINIVRPLSRIDAAKLDGQIAVLTQLIHRTELQMRYLEAKLALMNEGIDV